MPDGSVPCFWNELWRRDDFVENREVGQEVNPAVDQDQEVNKVPRTGALDADGDRVGNPDERLIASRWKIVTHHWSPVSVCWNFTPTAMASCEARKTTILESGVTHSFRGR